MAELEESSSPAPQLTKVSQQLQVPAFSEFPANLNGDYQMFPIMYPALVPGLNPFQNQEPWNGGPGIYAVPVLPYMAPNVGLSSNTLIPLTYKIPTGRSSSEVGSTGEAGQVGGQHQQQQAAPQRQVVVRRFRIAFQLDLLLIIKLAAVIFLFNQDGSRQRLAVLVFFASLIYFYQTGALTPFIRWLSQGMQRAARPPRPVVRAHNIPAAAGRQGNENAPLAEGEAVAGNDNPVVENAAVEANEGYRWWGIAKEIQMIVFGFITSLLPGFHNIE